MASVSVDDLKTKLLGHFFQYYEFEIRALIDLKEQAEKSGDLTETSRLQQEAFGYAERSRARALLDVLTHPDLMTVKPADAALGEQQKSLEAAMADLEHQLQSATDPLNLKANDEKTLQTLEDLGQQLSAKRKAYADLLVQLRVKDPQYAAFVSITPPDLQGIQTSLPQGVALVEYYLTFDKCVIFVITKDDLHQEEVEIYRTSLSDKVSAVRLKIALQNDEEGLANDLRDLYDLLIAPVRAYLPVTSNGRPATVGFIPHDTLNLLPFGALMDADGHYLIEDYSIFYLPSASSLGLLLKPVRPAQGDSLIIGNPSADASTPLRYAEEEARQIAEYIGVQPLLGESATESVFKTKAPNARIIHIAAHAFLDSGDPLFSSLSLAADTMDDGKLEVHEIYGLSLPATSLVTLSACNTQGGTLVGGDEYVGLARAFIYAGTPTVVASLWTVDDESTSQLMKKFYANLARGIGKAEAMRTAQLEMLHNNDYRHPKQWAAFNVIGEYSGQVAMPIARNQAGNSSVMGWPLYLILLTLSLLVTRLIRTRDSNKIT